MVRAHRELGDVETRVGRGDAVGRVQAEDGVVGIDPRRSRDGEIVDRGLEVGGDPRLAAGPACGGIEGQRQRGKVGDEAAQERSVIDTRLRVEIE